MDDAFAVVSTNDIPNLPVTLSNRVIGRSDEDGMLLVARLNAWQKNPIGIDPLGLPANVRITSNKEYAVPRQGAGTLVKFGIERVRAATVVLVDKAGKPMPVGSTAHLVGQADQSAIVGYDGIVYLDTLQDHNVLEVQTRDSRCRVQFDFKSKGDLVPRIGPYSCLPEHLP